jgi:hypothetical protein
MIFTLEKTMASGFSALNQRMDNFEARLIPLEAKMNNIEVIVTDVHEDLDAGLAAIDKNAVMLLEHNKRIGRLEKRAA